MNLLEQAVDILGGKFTADNKIMVKCPAHADNDPSLEIKKEAGKILVHCFAGCPQNDVVQALKDQRLWPGNNGKPPSKYIAEYVYIDETGKALFKVLRTLDKSFPQMRADGSGGWAWGVKDVRKVPYKLPDILKNQDIFICEGEKDADRLHSLGLCATTCPGGAGKWQPEYNQHFKGKNVVILPDNDEPGRNHAHNVARNLSGIASSVKVLELPGVPDKGDVSDFLKPGDDKEKLLSLVESCPEWEQQPEPEPVTEPDDWVPVDLMPLLNIEPPEIKWFVKDRILGGRGGIASGVGGSSKTRLMYHLGAGAALGYLPWDWEIATAGRSVLILTEDTADDLHRTIHNLCLSLNLSLEEKQTVYQSIIPFPLAGLDARLLIKSQTGTLIKSKMFSSLVQKIKDYGNIAFVGLDPALGLTDGDETDQGNQRILGKMADDLGVQTGAATMLVTHAAKGSLQADELASHNSRGGGAITDAVRSEFVMRTMTAKEAGKAKIKDKEERFRHVQLVATKGNYLPPGSFLSTWLRRDQYGMLQGTDLVLSESSGPTKQDIQALTLLKNISLTGPVTISEWRNFCVSEKILDGPTEGANTQQMKRIRKKLQDEGLIKQGSGKGVWIPCEPEEQAADYDFNYN